MLRFIDVGSKMINHEHVLQALVEIGLHSEIPPGHLQSIGEIVGDAIISTTILLLSTLM